MSTDTGGSAFPDPGRAQSAKQREALTETGLTIRDYFAAKALQGLLSSASGSDITNDGLANVGFQEAANSAYGYADAMLKARQS